ncbi:MAG: lipopolysaccharide A protein [Bacteroidaceae bacterium]|nr:lipopolysaccharide A protein [Bacteroidaceae bacterium]
MNAVHFSQLRKPLRKLTFYIRNFCAYAVPNAIMRSRARRVLQSLSAEERQIAEYRANYMCRLPEGASLPDTAIRVGDYHYPWRAKHKFVTYFFDLYSVVRCFEPSLRFAHLFGDVNRDQPFATFVKSRPVVADGGTSNCVVLKLNQVRHFSFLSDSKSFRQKQGRIVFRNIVSRSQPQRTTFLELFINNPIADAGMVNANSDTQRTEWLRPFMSIEEQLDFKFIACIEGNDVATNLKWVMSSNSVAVMPRPRFETWFMEGTLVPDYHYIEVAADYHDLEQKLQYYIQHPEEAEAIIYHAHEYIKQFGNRRLELASQLLTARRYFSQTGQLCDL